MRRDEQPELDDLAVVKVAPRFLHHVIVDRHVIEDEKLREAQCGLLAFGEGTL